MNLVKYKNYIKNNTLEIIVRPNAKKNEIIFGEKGEDRLKVNIKAPPENNKANIELVKFLSKEMKKKVKIISGHRGRRKVVEFY